MTGTPDIDPENVRVEMERAKLAGNWTEFVEALIIAYIAEYDLASEYLDEIEVMQRTMRRIVVAAAKYTGDVDDEP